MSTNAQIEDDIRMERQLNPRIPRRRAAVSGAEVTGGWVTVDGDVDFQFQSDEAFDDAATVFGVVGMTNEIRVTTPDTDRLRTRWTP